MRPSSLSSRLIISSAVVSIVLLAATGVLLAGLFTAALERNFDQRLRSVSDGILAGLDVDDAGTPRLSQGLADPRFGLPLSGWYWQVVPRGSTAGAGDLASASLLEQRLAVPANVTRDEKGVAAFYLEDTNGVSLRAIEQDFTLPGSQAALFGSGGGKFRRAERGGDGLHPRPGGEPRAAGAWPGAGHLRAGAIRAAPPARRWKPNLAEIRQGRAEQLKGDYPSEIQPVAEELNLLIQSNVEIVERARTQVGNLAHALKTPLSVLTNEAAAQEGPLAAKVREQAELMRNQVSLYLDRARRAARAQGMGAVTEVKPVLEALARTLERINRDKAVSIKVDCPDGLKFRGERQDLEEMVGNLLDNGCKWAAGRVALSAAPAAEPGYSGPDVSGDRRRG